MLQAINFKIIGVSPLLMHNGQLANPFNAMAKSMKKVSGKRDKTEADMEELARLEWYGSLYLKDGAPCIPGELLEATLMNAAKKSKKGIQVKAGLICDGSFALSYAGPKNIDALWEEEDFRFMTGVVIKRNRIMRTRPIFREWQLDFTVHFNDTLLNPSDIREFVRVGGEIIGLGDWRPKFGRYILGSL